MALRFSFRCTSNTGGSRFVVWYQCVRSDTPATLRYALPSDPSVRYTRVKRYLEWWDVWLSPSAGAGTKVWELSRLSTGTATTRKIDNQCETRSAVILVSYGSVYHLTVIQNKSLFKVYQCPVWCPFHWLILHITILMRGSEVYYLVDKQTVGAQEHAIPLWLSTRGYSEYLDIFRLFPGILTTRVEF